MPAHPAISAELRDWILATHGAGHDAPTVVALLLAHGYGAEASRAMVAEVLGLPQAGDPPVAGAPGARRTRHPEGPLANAGDREVRVTLAVPRPPCACWKACSATRSAGS